MAKAEPSLNGHAQWHTSMVVDQVDGNELHYFAGKLESPKFPSGSCNKPDLTSEPVQKFGKTLSPNTVKTIDTPKVRVLTANVKIAKKQHRP